MPGRIVEISGECPGSTPKLPSVPGTTTISTIVERTSRAGVPSSNCTRSAIYLGARGHFAALFDRLLDRADHVERRLRQLVILPGDDALEALDRVFEVDEDARR